MQKIKLKDIMKLYSNAEIIKIYRGSKLIFCDYIYNRFNIANYDDIKNCNIESIYSNIYEQQDGDKDFFYNDDTCTIITLESIEN